MLLALDRPGPPGPADRTDRVGRLEALVDEVTRRHRSRSTEAPHAMHDHLLVPMEGLSDPRQETAKIFHPRSLLIGDREMVDLETRGGRFLPEGRDPGPLEFILGEKADQQTHLQSGQDRQIGRQIAVPVPTSGAQGQTQATRRGQVGRIDPVDPQGPGGMRRGHEILGQTTSGGESPALLER